jgi:hypothetical protein
LAGAAGLGFLPTLAPFFGLVALAPFLALGAPFFAVAPFVDEAFSGATCAPRFRKCGGVFGNGGFCVRHGVESFLRLAHDDSSLWLRRNARELLAVSIMNLQEANGWLW